MEQEDKDETEVQRLRAALLNIAIVADQNRHSMEALMSNPPMNLLGYRLKQMAEEALYPKGKKEALGG